ncbi:MAG: hypothetical protein MMC33_005657 [Icmadophila ericetorum]|nr:hypothetical protein [Icmadophila ericetorum]
MNTFEEEAFPSEVNGAEPASAEVEHTGNASEASNDTLVEPPSRWRRAYNILTWTPKNCRYDPDKPFAFSLPLNLLFAFACTFTVANLYYSHPILNLLAKDFGVTYERASDIPTLAQAGYACGLLFLCPLADVLKRRAFVLALVFLTATFWIGLCITRSFAVFEFLSFLTALMTVTPQLMLPLVAGLAPPARRATAISLVVSGLLLGLLVARVLSGVISDFSSWRNVYWMALGLQYFIFTTLFFFMPDYPSVNPDGLNYFRILWTIITITISEPVLIQACLVQLFMSAIFTSFWTTLTFLLASPPYNYSSLVIGLFALIGIASLCFGPIYSRLVLAKFVPLFSILLGQLVSVSGVIVGTYIGTFTVAGPVIQAFAIDLGLQMTQIANRTSIYVIAPKAQNRVNTAYTVSVFFGQLIGTSAGNSFYAQGGWRKSGNGSIGFVCASIVIALLRGPWENGYVGWRGGWSLRPKGWGMRKDEENAEGRAEEKREANMSAEESAPAKQDTEVEGLTGDDKEMNLKKAVDDQGDGKEINVSGA